MPYNKLPRLRDPRNRDFVHQTKDMFMEQYKEHPELYYEEDAKLVENMDFLLQRCLISKRKNVHDSFEMLDNMLKWRKQCKLRELCDQDFPVEYFLSGAAFAYEPDKFGNRTLYIRSALLRCSPELKDSLKRYIAYLMYTIDDCINGEPWSVVFDVTNTGWNNYDIDLLMHFLSLLKEYFPVNVDYVLIINFPWVLSAAWTLVKRLIPPERRDVVIFINDSEVNKFIEPQNLPDFLGGSCQREHKLSPKACPTIDEYLQSQMGSGISTKRLRDIVKTLGDVLPKEHFSSILKKLENNNQH